MFGDLQYQEISDVTGIGLNSVRSQLFEARKRLKPILDQYFRGAELRGAGVGGQEDLDKSLKAIMAVKRDELGEPPTPEELLAYRDGRIDPAERRRMEARIAVYPDAARALADLAAFPAVEPAPGTPEASPKKRSARDGRRSAGGCRTPHSRSAKKRRPWRRLGPHSPGPSLPGGERGRKRKKGLQEAFR